MSNGRGEGQRGSRSMYGPPTRPLFPPMQRPPAACTVSSPPVPINSLSSPKSPPSLASPSSSVTVSVSASDLCVCTYNVAVAVPLIPVLAVIVIVRPPYNYFPRPCTFLSLVMDSVTCINFVPEARERLVQQKKIWLENSPPLDNRRRIIS